MISRQRALKLRTLIEQAAAGLDDKDASQGIELFGGMKYDGSLIEVNTRINWKGQLKRAAVNLWDSEQNDPDHAPTLWEDIGYRDGIRIIPETITVGTAFAQNERGWWGDDLYTSLLDNNVWTPEQYPDGWRKE